VTAVHVKTRAAAALAELGNTPDAVNLDHHAQDLEALAWTSPAVTRMRRIVAAEQRQRAGREVGGRG
jgi:hypothetical protein